MPPTALQCPHCDTMVFVSNAQTCPSCQLDPHQPIPPAHRQRIAERRARDATPNPPAASAVSTERLQLGAAFGLLALAVLLVGASAFSPENEQRLIAIAVGSGLGAATLLGRILRSTHPRIL